MTVLVFTDRDGTLNRDENYYLGSNSNWREQVEILEGVVEGLLEINKIPESRLYIITNQTGVAMKKFPELDFTRMWEVNGYICDLLRKEGVWIDGVYACPYVDNQYIKRKKGVVFDPKYVHERHPDIKPNPGMVKKALRGIDNPEIYVIGDRITDVQTALNIGGTGILVESSKTNELGDKEKLDKLEGKTYLAKNFLDAARYIKNSI